MATPRIFKLGQQVICHGRPAYIITIQRGVRHNSGQQEGIYYGVHHLENARKPAFTVHESQIGEMPVDETPKIALVKP